VLFSTTVLEKQQLEIGAKYKTPASRRQLWDSIRKQLATWRALVAELSLSGSAAPGVMMTPSNNRQHPFIQVTAALLCTLDTAADL
jgi:hypothetical protein